MYAWQYIPNVLECKCFQGFFNDKIGTDWTCLFCILPYVILRSIYSQNDTQTVNVFSHCIFNFVTVNLLYLWNRFQLFFLEINLYHWNINIQYPSVCHFDIIWHQNDTCKMHLFISDYRPPLKCMALVMHSKKEI